MRLSIEISPEEHQQLKAAAALQGKSIKDYVLERTLPDAQEKAALQKLESFLKPRIDTAMNGKHSSLSVDDIFDEVENQSQQP